MSKLIPTVSSFALTYAEGVYFGLMSGTSMDGIDSVATYIEKDKVPIILARETIPFQKALRQELFALQQPGENEIHRAASAAILLTDQYAQCCKALLQKTQLTAPQIRAIGAHGQTIRHHPKAGYSSQILNGAYLAEQLNIDVITDFRSRDIAAKGQGAPLVPAFQKAFYASPTETRVICNLGGISNITILSAHSKTILGFDCGPANVLIDYWANQHHQMPFDKNGQFAAQGTIHSELLEYLLNEDYFHQAPPKSTGRDLFNEQWLSNRLAPFLHLKPADIQATLTALTAESISRDIAKYAPECKSVFLCGGGANNPILVQMIQQALSKKIKSITLQTTDNLGIPTQDAEAVAFAWLAYCFIAGLAVDLSHVTGAISARRLGALYPR